MTENGLATMPTDGASTERGLSRRDVLLAGLALPALGGGVGVSSLLLSDPAKAATAGQCVVGVTQEAVNFNPLLYVNTGVETCVEFIVFDSLWKIDPQGKFIPNLAAEIPTRGKRRRLEGRPHLDDQAAPRRHVARRRAVHRRRRRLHARRYPESESHCAQPQRPRARRALCGEGRSHDRDQAEGQLRALSRLLAEDQHHSEAHPRDASPTSTPRRSTPIRSAPARSSSRSGSRAATSLSSPTRNITAARRS